LSGEVEISAWSVDMLMVQRVKKTMEHDPKCPATNKLIISGIICTFCQIIRSIRAEYEPEVERKFDWRSYHDERSKDFPIRFLLPEQSINTSKLWTEGPVLDQGSEGACVGFGWMAELTAEPIVPDPMPITASAEQEALTIYKAAQLIDEWPGEDYSGTSVLAGAKIMQEKGYIKEYRWCFSVEDLRDTVLNYGPVVIGVPWYQGMYVADNGLVSINGELVGGHCLTVTGYIPQHTVNGVTDDMFRWRNSWGTIYGDGGSAYIRVSDMQRLVNEGGEMCVPLVRTLPEKDSPEPTTDPAFESPDSFEG